jgi:putative ABC transport system ATP-binding protein
MAETIKLIGINKYYPLEDQQIRILHDVNLELKLGELAMIVGPSGAGKTTLISILSGILSTTTGEVNIMGVLINNISAEERALFRRENIGLIFQQYNLLPALTAEENASIALAASGLPYEKCKEEARKVLEKIGLKEHARKLPKQLSGGEQQRVAIARALVNNPRLIICDEPTAALDAETGDQVMKILRDIANDKNRAVLIVTHDDRIYHFADRIYEMSDGRIIGNYAANEFIKE